MPANEDEQRGIELNINDRIESLVPIYREAVLNFASLHHSSKRALEKGCINDLIPWKTSRMFFYWRLKRLLTEDYFIKKICETYKDVSISKAKCE